MTLIFVDRVLFAYEQSWVLIRNNITISKIEGRPTRDSRGKVQHNNKKQRPAEEVKVMVKVYNKMSLLFKLVVSIAASANTFGPGALNNLIFFVVDNEPNTFMCGSPSSRCVFQREEYSSDPQVRGGNVADQLEGAVWATVDPTADKLILENCQADVCITACFNDCTCTDASGNNCTKTTPFPTEAPGTPAPTPIPVAPRCEQKTEDTSRCPDLMPNVPIGTKCDCYNFCHNNFTSCCQVGAGCGSTDCEVEKDSTPGGVGSYVWGCTDFDRRATDVTGSNGTSGGGGSGSSSHGTPARSQAVPVFAALALVGAGLFV
jgi:hypothetical protein